MKKHIQVLIHFIIWAVVLVMPLTLQLRANPELAIGWKVHSVILSGFHLIAFYSSFLFLSPVIIRRKSLFKNVLIFFLTGIIIYSIKVGLTFYFNSIFDDLYRQANLLTIVTNFSFFINYMLIMLLALLIRISIKWYQDQKIQSELLFQHQTQELALLKAQVNPHFFFNTLNNIYSLVYKKSDDAPAALLKLSEIMRYMLYDSKSDTVPLPKELSHLENYLELEKLRLKDPDFISYKIEGDPNNIMVPPMLLLSFVENAFKHGKKRVENPGITIRVKVMEGHLYFMVANFTLGKQESNNESGGIGLQNITRRLELLYPESHSLNIINESDQYVVNLELKRKPINIK